MIFVVWDRKTAFIDHFWEKGGFFSYVVNNVIFRKSNMVGNPSEYDLGVDWVQKNEREAYSLDKRVLGIEGGEWVKWWKWIRKEKEFIVGREMKKVRQESIDGHEYSGYIADTMDIKVI